jgi:polygalacturonase
MAQQPPTLPSIGSAYDNITVSNSNVDGGATASGSNTATNTAVINDAIAYISSQGGGTVEIPASSSAYVADELFMQDNVDLKVDTGATLQNGAPSQTFITTTGATHDLEISGGGIINGNATGTSENNMMPLENVTNLEVTEVQINNASHEHLVTEADSNVTINGVTINDANTNLANTDGIDFSGSNFLIENCSVNDGDDDICAKPEYTACSNIVIDNCSIGNGHGISIGGQTQKGLNGMLVENITMNNTVNGLRMKAGDGSIATLQNGGLVENVTYMNVTMTNVQNPIIINSFYDEGNDNYPSTMPFPVATYDATTPIFDNIKYENINISNDQDAARIYGLNISPPNINNLLFENVTVENTASEFKMYYASGVSMSNISIDRSGSDEKPDDLYSYYADVFVNPMLWTGTGSHSLGAADISGTWDSSTTNWLAYGNLDVFWTENNSAQFGAGSGTNSTPVTVTLAGPHTVGIINFSPNSPAYTLNGYSITINGDGEGDGITVNNATATINSAIVLPAGGTPIGISVASGGVLNLTGTWTSNNPTATLTKSGSGVVNMHNLSIAGLSITGGTLALTAGGGTAGTSLISGGTLAISGGGALDINDHGMVIEYGSGTSPVGDLSFAQTARNYPANSIQAYAQTGFDGLNWDGPGINSSVAKNDSSGLTAVGVADENDLTNVYPANYTVAGGGTGTWMGQPITDPNNVLVRLTYYGDGNLDGVVNKFDVAALAEGYSGLAGYVGWSDGDYTYAGFISKLDISLLAESYVFQGAPLGDGITAGEAQYLLALDPDMSGSDAAAFDAIAAGQTPEPASLGLLGGAGLLTLARRRR